MDRPDIKDPKYSHPHQGVWNFAHDCEAYMDHLEGEIKRLTTSMDWSGAELRKTKTQLQASNERVKELKGD